MPNIYHTLISMFAICFEISENDMIESEYFYIKIMFQNIQTTKKWSKKSSDSCKKINRWFMFLSTSLESLSLIWHVIRNSKQTSLYWLINKSKYKKETGVSLPLGTMISIFFKLPYWSLSLSYDYINKIRFNVIFSYILFGK